MCAFVLTVLIVRPPTPTCLNLTLSNGVISYNPATTPILEGATATHFCTTGYQMTGLMVRTCTATGWSTGDDPVCTGEGDVCIVLTVLIVRHHSHL